MSLFVNVFFLPFLFFLLVVPVDGPALAGRVFICSGATTIQHIMQL